MTGIKALLEKYSDLFLAAAVVMLVATMIVGVSPGAMDVLIAVNIATAVIVLMVALYTAEPVKVAAFPTILLLTTLFRLALNISSTRLILVQEDAGEVIEAFGRFVVGGDFVVGAIVFVVLVLVQFVVIAKGAERVAEVGARFTLDALPGKQMSIDADMRNGLIDEQGAKQRRELLDKEAKLYGAMDGAMKFVKGDAIAGILISLVNIVGGLIVGLMRDMEIGEAAATFTLLTVGDGLVSQIPALLISVAAGLVVTRVGDPNQSTSGRLARDIIQQVADNPRSLAVASVFLIVIGVSAPWTGFPALPFLMLGIGTGVAFAMRDRSGDGAEGGTGAAAAAGAGAGGGPLPSEIASLGAGGATLAPPPIVIEVHPALDEAFFDMTGEEGHLERAARADVTSELLRMQHAVTRALGVPIPRILLASESRKVGTFGYAIVVHGEPLASGQFLPGHVIALTTPEAAQQHGLDATPALLPGTRIVAAQIPSDQADAARAAGLQVSEVRDVVFRHVALVLQRHATEFLGIQEVSDLLEELRQSARDLVDTVVQRLKIDELTDVLQGLLNDEVPITGLRNILESLARRAGRADPRTDLPVGTDTLIEGVRLDVRRSLCARYAEGERRLRCYSLDADLEARLRSVSAPGAKSLSPNERSALQTTIMSAIDPYVHLDKHPILVVSEDLRQQTRTLLRPVAPECAVLTHEELSPEFVIDHVAVIRAAGAEPLPASA